MSNIVLKKNQVNNSVIPNLRDAISNLNLAYNKLNQLNIPSDFIQKTYLNNVKNNIDEMRKNLTRYTNNIKNIVTKINNIENKNQNFNNANNNYNNKTINKSNSNIKPSLVSNTFVNRAFTEQNKMTSTKINKNGFSFQSIIDNIKNPNKLKENIKNGFNSLQKFYKDNKDTINTALIVIAALKSGGNKKENNYPDNAEKIAKDMTNSIISNMKDGKILINSALNGKGGLKDTYSTVWNGITNTANAALNGKGGLKDTYSGVLNSIANNELVKNTASGWNIILTNPGRSGENLKIAGDWALNGKGGIVDAWSHPDVLLSDIGMAAAGFTTGLAKGIEGLGDGLLKLGGLVVKGGLSIYDVVRGDFKLTTANNYDKTINQVVSYDVTKQLEDTYFSNKNVQLMEKKSDVKRDDVTYNLSSQFGRISSNILLLTGTSVAAATKIPAAASLVSGVSSFGENYEKEINKNSINVKYGTNDLQFNIDYNTLLKIKNLKTGSSTTITQILPTSDGKNVEVKLNVKAIGNGNFDITDQNGNKIEFNGFQESNSTKAETVSLIKGSRDAILYYLGAKVNEAQFEPLVGNIKNSVLKTTAQSAIRVSLDSLSGAVVTPSDSLITMIADNKSWKEAWEENGGITAMTNNIIMGAAFSTLSEVGNIKSAAKGSKVANKIKVDGFTKETLDEISKLKGYGLKTYIEDSIKNGTFESTYKYINKQELNNIEKMFNKTDTQIINDTRIDYKIHLEDDILTTISSNKLTLEQYNYMKNLKGSELEGFINKASYFNKLNEVSNYLNEKEVSKVAPNLKGTKAGEELSNILNIKRIVENESNNLTADQKSIQESLNRFNNAKKYSDDLQIAIDYKDKTQYLFTRLEQLKETFNTKDLNECYNKFSDYSNSAKDPNAIYKVIKPYLPKEERLALSKLNIFNILGKNEYKNLHKLDDIFNFKSKLSEAEQKELYAYSKALGPVIGGYCRKCDVTFTVNSNGLSMTYKYKDSQKWYDVGCQRYNMKQKNISQAIEMIDGIIKKSPGLKEDTILYRGANGLYFDGSEVDLSSLKVGDIINDPAFVSTSISKDKFYDRSDIHIEILAPKGTEGAYIETFVGGYSQQEVLLKRDTNFKVISEPTPFKIVDGYGIERTKFKVILEIVPDEVADKFRLNNSKLNITTELPNHAIKNNVTTELPNNAIKNNVTTELPNHAIKNNVTAELPNHAIKHNLDIVNDLNLKTNKKISSEFNKYNNIFNKNITGVNVDEFIEKLQKKRLLMIYDESIQDINSIYSRGQKGVIHHDVEHVERVMLYSMYMGDELNLNTKEMSMLIDAAKYHDVGVYAGHKDHASRSAAEAMDKLKNNYSTEDLNKIAAVIKYHEVADMVNSNGTLIYDDSKFKNIMKEFNIPESEYDSLRKIALILKDADAIDRTRFKNNLDTRYFKNQDLANSLVKTSYQLQEIQAKKTLDENLRNGFYSENDKAIINNYRNEGVPDYIILESYSTWYMWPNKNGSRLYSSPNDMIEKWMKGI